MLLAAEIISGKKKVLSISELIMHFSAEKFHLCRIQKGKLGT